MSFTTGRSDLSVSVSFDQSKVKQKIHARIELAQKVLDAQVMKDSNYYVPMQEGFLRDSVLSSVIGSGLLVWDIEYAKKMYHFPEARISKEVNPNASPKWFERAKATRLKIWEALVNREYSK